MITKITLGIALLFLLIVGAEQNKTIMAQRDTLRAMAANPACMVDQKKTTVPLLPNPNVPREF